MNNTTCSSHPIRRPVKLVEHPSFRARRDHPRETPKLLVLPVVSLNALTAAAPSAA
jgi:hypothetical protein